MKKILILALVLMSAKLLAEELPKDTLWSLQTGNHLFNNAMFSFDDKKIYANDRGNAGFELPAGILVLDAQKGDSLDFITGINIGRESVDGSYFMSIHPNNIESKENNVEKYDFKTIQKIWTCPKREKDDLLFVAYSQNAKYVLLIYSGTNLDIYNTETQELVKSLSYKGKFNWLYDGFAIDNKGEKILTTAIITKDFKVGEVSYLIDVATGEILKEMYFAEGIQQNQSAMFSAQNNYVLAKQNDYISVLDLRTMYSFVYTPSGGGGYGSRVGAISKDEKYLYSGGVKKGSVEIFDLLNKKIFYTAEKVSKFDGVSAYGDLSKSNTMLTLGFPSQLFNIGISLTSLDNPTNIDNTIYPNPTTGQLQINVSITIPTQIYAIITDLSGKNLQNANLGFYEAGNVHIPINVANLPKGNYILTLNGNNLSKSFKLIKE